MSEGWINQVFFGKPYLLKRFMQHNSNGDYKKAKRMLKSGVITKAISLKYNPRVYDNNKKNDHEN
jgi:hypothetical protein